MSVAQSFPVEFIVNITIAIVDMLCFLFSGFLFSLCVDSILKKSGTWFSFLVGSIAIMLFMTALFSWAPGLLGYEVTYMEGEIVLKQGAIFRNLGIVCFLTGASIALALLKYLWAVIRRREKFSGGFVFLELLFGAAIIAAGYYLYQDDRVIQLGEQSSLIYIGVLVVSAVVAFSLVRSALKRI